MTLKEFTSQDERCITRPNVIYYFKKYKEYEWLIDVSLPGTPYETTPILNHWHSATTIVLDTEAHAIYENLLNDQGEA